MSFQDPKPGRLLKAWRKLANVGRRQRQDPSQAVSAGVIQIATAVGNLERLVNAIGTPRDTAELREELRKSKQQIGQLVKDTSEKLRQASEIDQHRAEVRASNAKVAKDFQNILKEFQKVQRIAAERETAFAPFVQQVPSRVVGPHYEEPWQAVSAGIFLIRASVCNFERIVNAIGTPKDTPELREKLRELRQQIRQSVKDTSEKLRQASKIDQHHGEVSASKKIADATVAKDFQNILREFQKLQRLAAERETTFAPLVQQVSSSSYNVTEVDSDSNKSAERVIMLAEPRRQEILLLDDEIATNWALIEEREQVIEDVEQQMDQVKEIFKDLLVLVHDRGTMIDDIDVHIENSYAATVQAKSKLAKAAKTQKRNSSMACLMLVILGIIFLILIIVLAAKSCRGPCNPGLLKLRLVKFLTVQS